VGGVIMSLRVKEIDSVYFEGGPYDGVRIDISLSLCDLLVGYEGEYRYVRDGYIYCLDQGVEAVFVWKKVTFVNEKTTHYSD
jgi:hypothetical protein